MGKGEIRKVGALSATGHKQCDVVVDGPGLIDVLLAPNDALYVRSHYDTVTIMLPDGPLPNEIAIICRCANRGQLNARVGGLAAGDINGKDGLT